MIDTIWDDLSQHSTSTGTFVCFGLVVNFFFNMLLCFTKQHILGGRREGRPPSFKVFTVLLIMVINWHPLNMSELSTALPLGYPSQKVLLKFITNFCLPLRPHCHVQNALYPITALLWGSTIIEKFNGLLSPDCIWCQTSLTYIWPPAIYLE